MNMNLKSPFHICLYFPKTGDAGQSYIDALKKEIISSSDDFKKSDIRSLTLLYPFAFGANSIASLVRECVKSFNIAKSTEIVLRALPGSISLDVLGTMKSSGVNKIDIDVFSTLEEDCAALNLSGYPKALENSSKILYAMGFSSLGLRMMLNIPGQNELRFKKSMGRILEFAPEHVTYFSNGEWNEYDKTRFSIAKDFLSKYSYNVYSLGCLTKTKPWESYLQLNDAEILGLGLGAYSRLDEASYYNTLDINHYIKYSDNFEMLVDRLGT